MITDMKKCTIIFSLLAVMFSLAGCTYYDNSEPCRFHKQTVKLVVNEREWAYDESVNQFYCHFNVPEITESVYDYGEISVSREYNAGTKNAYQVALPETTYKKEDLGNDQYAYYAQHVDYVIGIGYVEVFYTISDFFYPDGEGPEAMDFRLQITY